MNAIRCPQCKHVNATSALLCGKCDFSFDNLPSTAYVSVPATEYEQTSEFGTPPPLFGENYKLAIDNETGAKVHFWYRIYCGVFVAIAIALFCLGIYMIISPPGTFKSEAENGQFLGGLLYTIVAPIVAAIYSIALFSPRKPWAWLMGVILLAIGIVTCCFLPSLILLIYWAKEDTRVYFGRT